MKPAKNHVFLDEMTDPAAQPMIWVAKWVDYSDKYGFGYQLSDEGVGVMFNDTTKLIMLPNGINVHYIDKNAEESYMTMDNYPRMHDKKMKLLSYFSRYMREHLIMTGASVVREVDTMSRTPHLHQWCRSTSGVLMQLNNGTVQMNFSDHTKIIMCPLMAAITYIDEEKQFRTFRFSSLENNGCNVALYEKMRYAYDKITVLLDPENNYLPH
jgi:polo-like kinase 1